MRSFLVALLFGFVILPGTAFAKRKKWKVPCEKVFVTGTQVHEIAWALRGEGLRDNLYRHTCQEPVSKASEAGAILDLEWSPYLNPAGVAGEEQAWLEERQRQLESPDYFVSCYTTLTGSYCTDSDGNALETSCSDSGCSSYYGPDPGLALLDVLHGLSYSLQMHFAKSAAWGYLFSARDHKPLWQFTGYGIWWMDLAKYAECPKRGIFEADHGTCKTPKGLLK